MIKQCIIGSVLSDKHQALAGMKALGSQDSQQFTAFVVAQTQKLHTMTDDDYTSNHHLTQLSCLSVGGVPPV